jgi:pimeloyl-ACP methyl ester carboxylesterase
VDLTSRTLTVRRGPYGLYAELTPGSGVPLVLMHGFPDNTHLYDRLVPQLAGRRPVVRFDFLVATRGRMVRAGSLNGGSSVMTA